MSTNAEKVQSIINVLKELDSNNSFSVFLPSLNASAKFKQLNTEQFKRILKTIIDSPVYNTEFITTFNSLIKENIIDNNINIDNLTIFDKLSILIKTRIECISPEYNFTFTDEERNDLNLTETSHTVNLAEHYNNFISNVPHVDTQTITHEDYTIICNLPTLDTENKLEKELHKNIKLEISTPEELRTTLGDTFINEISKYIRKIEVRGTEVDFNDLLFKMRVKVVEQLPSIIINKILQYIENYKKAIKPITSYRLHVEGKTVEKDLPLDATLFNM